MTTFNGNNYPMYLGIVDVENGQVATYAYYVINSAASDYPDIKPPQTGKYVEKCSTCENLVDQIKEVVDWPVVCTTCYEAVESSYKNKI